MDNDLIREELLNCIKRISDIDLEDSYDACNGEDKNLIEQFGLDSISVIQLLSDIEEYFGISIPENDIVECMNDFEFLLETVARCLPDEGEE